METQNIDGNLMPKAQSQDPVLLQAATGILTHECCGYVCRRMVINYAAKARSETKAWWRDGVVHEVTYDWQEFQAASAEPAKSGFVIYYNVFRCYRAADPTLPLNQWILHSRFRGAPITEENIEK